MAIAIEEAEKASGMGEVPIGAVVVYRPFDKATRKYTADPRIIARAHNMRETSNSPSAHAEFLAMETAAKELDSWRLSDCTVYVTLEPCIMCAGLMHQARVARCVFGAYDKKAGALKSLYSINEDARLNHRFIADGGICEQECVKLLTDFFNIRRNAIDDE